MDHNVTDLNSRRGRRVSVSDADIDAVIEQMMEANQGLLPSGEAVYEAVGSARTRCFGRLKYWQRQGEAQRLENPGQLPTAVLDGLQLVMTRLEQDVQARMAHRETEWELEKIALNQQIADAKKREIAETYRREDLAKQLAAVEHQLVASQTDNRHLRERNEALHQFNEQHKAEAHAAKKIADFREEELAASRLARAQLEHAVEQHRESYARLQEECRRLQEEQSRQNVRYQDVVSTATTQRQLFDRMETMWYQRTQQYESTIEGLRQQLQAETDENHARQAHVQQLQSKLDELPALTESKTDSRVASLQSVVEKMKQQLQDVIRPVQRDPAWQTACASAITTLLALAGARPEHFDYAEGAVQRLRWGGGTDDDIEQTIKALHTLPLDHLEHAEAARRAFPTVDAFRNVVLVAIHKGGKDHPTD